MTLDEALSDGVRNHLGEQGDGTDSVVVAGDRVLEVIRVCVGVQDSHHGNTQFASFVNSEVLTNRVDDPDRARRLLQGPNTAKGLLQLGQLALLEQQFLLGETLSGVVVVDFLKLFHSPQPLGHGLEVGQKTTQPALVDVGLAHAGCLLRHRLLSLLLRSHEENGSAVRNGLFDEVVGLIDEGQGLLKVDDVNAAALGQDKALDFRVPAAGLVSKVNASVQ